MTTDDLFLCGDLTFNRFTGSTMNPIAEYPVYDLASRLLVKPGTELSPDFMDDFCRERKNGCASVQMFAYGNIKKDLLQQFTIHPYRTIFSGEKARAEVLAVMERITLPLPVLRAMDFFRRNDFHTYRHMLVISALTILIMDQFEPLQGIPADELFHFGPLHDLGKCLVPLEILVKREPLTIREMEVVRHHVVAGYVLVSHYFKSHRNLAAMIALDHHERLNGTGYSRGIEQESLIVEVTTVCDIYDALVSPRPYRPVSYDNRTALEELTRLAQWGEVSWKAVQALVAYNRRNRTEDVEDVRISMERRGIPPARNVYGIRADTERN